MAIRVRVRNGKQIIVPIRFSRAINGAPLAEAPDVDNRGFKMGTRPGDWGHSSTRGAMVSITEGDTVQIKVLREDIDNRGDLYVTSTDTAVVEVVESVAGGLILPDGIFRIRGVKDFRNRPVKIQVRLGGIDGIVLGELEPHVFRQRLLQGKKFLRVLVHFVTINGPAGPGPTPPATTVRTPASLGPLFDVVNAIWRPCGIQFQNPPETRNTTVNGAVWGQVTTNISASNWAEFSTLINTNHRPNRINIYCVRSANEFRGLSYDNDVARPNGYGIAIVDAADANDLAHELGHFLNLDGHSNQDAARNNIRFDMWCRRCLMFSYNPYYVVRPADGVIIDEHNNPAPLHRIDVGYGQRVRGALITVKNFVREPPGNEEDIQDGEVARARDRALNPY